MDTVYIRGLTVDTVIGIHDWERDIRQAVVLDLELGGDNAAAAATDAIADALDYAAIAERVTGFVRASNYQLIETLAEEVARIVLAEFPVAHLVLALSKPGAVPGAREVGVRIERGAAR
ncbi:MAG: dihydroneopterin aldolase [Halioglobus sp.]|nr:dihydroneopterin aldolase [Halioglobus sp.]